MSKVFSLKALLEIIIAHSNHSRAAMRAYFAAIYLGKLIQQSLLFNNRQFLAELHGTVTSRVMYQILSPVR